MKCHVICSHYYNFIVWGFPVLLCVTIGCHRSLRGTYYLRQMCIQQFYNCIAGLRFNLVHFMHIHRYVRILCQRDARHLKMICAQVETGMALTDIFESCNLVVYSILKCLVVVLFVFVRRFVRTITMSVENRALTNLCRRNLCLWYRSAALRRACPGLGLYKFNPNRFVKCWALSRGYPALLDIMCKKEIEHLTIYFLSVYNEARLVSYLSTEETICNLIITNIWWTS